MILIKVSRNYFNKFINFIYRFSLNKKRILFLNSYKSEDFLKAFFKKSIDYKRILTIFYNNNIFAYSDINQKEKVINLLKKYSSSKIKNFLEYAEKIERNELKIFEKEYKFNNQVNWYYSFFNNFNWEIKNSEDINLHPKDKNLDVKYVWELNRHQFLPYLGFAYYYTNDEKYAEKFRKLILNWIKKNPPMLGINWNSGLEVAIRLKSWIFSLFFFESSKLINNEKFFRTIFKSMFQHAYFLRFFSSHKTFNHSVGVLLGLYLFSNIFKKVKPIKRWEKKIYIKIKSQIVLQTRNDGTNIEQSINYHRFVLELFILFIILRPEILKDIQIHTLIKKMFDFLLFIIKPDKSFPLIGDSDEGKVLFMTSYEKNLFIHLFNLGSIIFQREDLKFISKKIHPISILLLGEKGYNTFEKLHIDKPNNIKSYFKNAGYLVFRNNWSKNSNYLFIDFARFGPKHASHTHSGLTNFIYCYNGKNIITDSGTYRYNESWEERNLFRGSKSHNILTINQKNQSKPISWFKWKGNPQIKREVLIDNNQIILRCIHNAYNGFLVERKINANKILNNLEIKDTVFILNNKDINKFININLYLHFDCQTKLTLIKKRLIINNQLKIDIISKLKFDMNLENHYYSPRYGIKHECKMLIIHLKHRFKENESIEIITKIFPLSNV